MALVRVYCGLASAKMADDQSGNDGWLSVSAVDDAGRILDICEIRDDADGFAELDRLLAQRANDPSMAAVATDSDEHRVIQFLTAAGRYVAYTDEDSADDYAERFADNRALNELARQDGLPDTLTLSAPGRRAVGLARALQAGVLSAVPQSPPRDMLALKPILIAHTAAIAGRLSAAATLREVLRELYPAALRAFSDPAQPIPLAILDALPEPGAVGGAGNATRLDEQVTAELVASGVGSPAELSEAVAALRAAIAETPRRTGVTRAMITAVTQTVRHSVAAVRSWNDAADALIGALSERSASRLTTAAIPRPLPAATNRLAAAVAAMPGPGMTSSTGLASVIGANGSSRGAGSTGSLALPAAPSPLRPAPESSDEPTTTTIGRRRASSEAPIGRVAPTQYGPPVVSAPPATSSGISIRKPDHANRGDGFGRPDIVEPAAGPGQTDAPGRPGLAALFPRRGGTSADAPTGPITPPAIPPPVAPPANGQSGFTTGGLNSLTNGANGTNGFGAGTNGFTGPANGFANGAGGANGASGANGFANGAGGANGANGSGQSGLPARQPGLPPGSGSNGYPPGSNGFNGGSNGSGFAGGSNGSGPNGSDSTGFAGRSTGSGFSGGSNGFSGSSNGFANNSPETQPAEVPRQREGRVPPPWQADDLLMEPPTLRIVDPVSLIEQEMSQRATRQYSDMTDSSIGMVMPQLVDPDQTLDRSPRRRGQQLDPAGPAEIASMPITADPELDGDLLIFAEARSAWFVDHLNPDVEVDWASSADVGWRAAEQAAQPLSAGDTPVGLPKRVPQQNLVPGSAQETAERQLRIVRDPATIAAHTTGYFQGWRRGQEVNGYSVGGRPGRESAGGWEFARDIGRDQQPEESEYPLRSRSAGR